MVLLVLSGCSLAFMLIGVTSLLLDGGVRWFAWFIFGLMGTLAFTFYGLKVRKFNRWPIAVGTVFTTVGAVCGTLAVTTLAAFGKLIGVGGESGQIGFVVLLLGIYTALLLGFGIPMIVWQKHHGGLSKLRKKRTGPAMIKPGDRDVETFYRPD